MLYIQTQCSQVCSSQFIGVMVKTQESKDVLRTEKCKWTTNSTVFAVASFTLFQKSEQALNCFWLLPSSRNAGVGSSQKRDIKGLIGHKRTDRKTHFQVNFTRPSHNQNLNRDAAYDPTGGFLSQTRIVSLFLPPDSDRGLELIRRIGFAPGNSSGTPLFLLEAVEFD